MLIFTLLDGKGYTTSHLPHQMNKCLINDHVRFVNSKHKPRRRSRGGQGHCSSRAQVKSSLLLEDSLIKPNSHKQKKVHCLRSKGDKNGIRWTKKEIVTSQGCVYKSWKHRSKDAPLTISVCSFSFSTLIFSRLSISTSTYQCAQLGTAFGIVKAEMAVDMPTCLCRHGHGLPLLFFLYLGTLQSQYCRGKEDR